MDWFDRGAGWLPLSFLACVSLHHQTNQPHAHHHHNHRQVGLGSLGVVSELTLQCIPQHQLLEKTYVVEDLHQVRCVASTVFVFFASAYKWVMDRPQVDVFTIYVPSITTQTPTNPPPTTPSPKSPQLRREHHHLLRTYRHVRYMWLPYTEAVVVVVSNPHDPKDAAALPAYVPFSIYIFNQEACIYIYMQKQQSLRFSPMHRRVSTLLNTSQHHNTTFHNDTGTSARPPCRRRRSWRTCGSSCSATPRTRCVCSWMDSLQTFISSGLSPIRAPSTYRHGDPPVHSFHPPHSLHKTQPNKQLAPADVEALGFTELRDALLDLAPLDAKHVRLCVLLGLVMLRPLAFWRSVAWCVLCVISSPVPAAPQHTHTTHNISKGRARQQGRGRVLAALAGVPPRGVHQGPRL